MSTPHVRRVAVGLLTSIVPVALLGGGLLRSVAGEQTFTAAYASTGTGRSVALDACVSVSAGATVAGTSSRARHRLFGWHDARVMGPELAVTVTDCSTGRALAGIDTLRVDQVWAESGCALAAEQGDSFAASTEETDDQDDDDAEGWQRTDGDRTCAEPAAQGTTTGDGSRLTSAEPALVLHYAGHTWSRDLCMTPSVAVWLTTRRGHTVVVPVTLPAACVGIT